MTRLVTYCLFQAVLPDHLVDDDTVYHINPSGIFIIGGPCVSQLTNQLASQLTNQLASQKASSNLFYELTDHPFQGDAGLTGRKIIVDTYGGWGAHGGGAFSGKDPTKVDRSAAYAARWVAKSLVKAGICKRVLVQVS